MEKNLDQCCIEVTSKLEKPMDIDQVEHKKHAHIPNNVSIQELNPGSPDTGTPKQKWLKNDELDTTSVATVINHKLFPKPKAAETQEYPSNVDNEDNMDQSTFPTGAQDFNLVKASPYKWQVW